MHTRILVFAKPVIHDSAVCLFGVFGESFSLNLGTLSLNDFAERNSFTRHDSFDWTVGDGGKSCALFECHVPETNLVGVTPSLPSSFQHDETGRSIAVKWMSFPNAAKITNERDDRRFLQLAVQFVASGSRIDDSVVAAPTDPDLLEIMKKHFSEEKEQ